MRQNKTTFITHAAMIAALYVALTYLANAMGLANNAVQIRFSEALTVLPYFTPAAIPGLFVGCFLSNLLTGCAVPDIVFGSLTTLLAAFATYKLRKMKYLAAVPPVVANTIVVPFILLYAYGVGPIWMSFVTVGIGEVISCGILGTLLLFALERYRYVIFKENT